MQPANAAVIVNCANQVPEARPAAKHVPRSQGAEQCAPLLDLWHAPHICPVSGERFCEHLLEALQLIILVAAVQC